MLSSDVSQLRSVCRCLICICARMYESSHVCEFVCACVSPRARVMRAYMGTVSICMYVNLHLHILARALSAGTRCVFVCVPVCMCTALYISAYTCKHVCSSYVVRLGVCFI